MAYSNGKVTAPIDLSDVAQALGETNEDVGRLCTSSKINPWAKYKPMQTSPNVPYTPDKYWKGVDGNCGWNWTAYGGTTGSLDDMIDLFTEDGKNGWSADRVYPFGETFLRITDFEGYNHNARPPFDRLYTNNEIEVEEGTEKIWITPMMAAAITSGGAIGLQDIQDIGIADPSVSPTVPYRFGAFIHGFVNGSRYYRRAISENPLWTNDSELEGANISAMVQIDISTLPVGEYQIYPILGSVAISGTEMEVDRRVRAIPCPYLRYATLKIVSAGSGGGSTSGFSMYGVATQREALDGVYIDFQFTFTNNAYAKTISGNSIMYYPDGSDTSIYRNWSVDDITVAAYSVQTITVSKLANDVSLRSSWKYSFGGGDYKQGPMAIQQRVDDDFNPGPLA